MFCSRPVLNVHSIIGMFYYTALGYRNSCGPKKEHTYGGFFKYLGTRRSALLSCNVKYLAVGGQASCQWEVFCWECCHVYLALLPVSKEVENKALKSI